MQLDERPRVRVLPRRDRFDRFVSVLVYVPRDRYDSGSGPRSATIWPRLPRPRQRPSIRSSRKARWCACTSSSAATSGDTPRSDRATLEHAVERHRAHLDRCARRGACGRTRAARARALFGALSRRLLGRLSRGLSGAAGAVATSAIIERLTAEPSARRRFLSPRRRRRQHRRRPESVEPQPPDPALRARAGAGEHGLSGRRRAHLSHRAGSGAGRCAGSTTCCWSAPTAAGRPRCAQRRACEACFIAVMRGQAENDGYNALVLARGPAVARCRAIRTLSRFLRQIARPLFAGLHVGDAAQAFARSRRRSSSCSTPRFDPRLGTRRRARARSRAIAAEIETALAAVESLDEDRILRRFVNAVRRRSAPISISSTMTARRSRLIAIKFDSRKLDGLPLPRPLYEIFVYSPRVEGVHLRFGKVARGGIRWSDRPQDFRTEVLGLVKAQQVKNAVIVPVGAKGGFVPKLHAGRRPPRGDPGRRHREPTSCSSRRCSTSPTIRPGRRDRAARRRGAPRRRRSLSGRRRRQGHRDLLRHRQRHFDRARLLARRCLRLRRLGRLRPQEDGHHRARRLGIGQAPFPRDGCRHRHDAVHDASASATCRATCSATACCARRPSSSLPPSITATSSSIPIPDRGEELRRAQAAVRSAALELAGLRQDADLGRRRRLFARGEGNHAFAPRRSGCSGSASKATPAEVMTRDPQGAGRSVVLRRHRHLCPRLGRKRRGGRRPRQRCRSASPAATCAAR